MSFVVAGAIIPWLPFLFPYRSGDVGAGAIGVFAMGIVISATLISGFARRSVFGVLVAGIAAGGGGILGWYLLRFAYPTSESVFLSIIFISAIGPGIALLGATGLLARYAVDLVDRRTA